MHDGGIVADEYSKIGEIPAALRRSMYFMPKKTVDDELAGISALMKAIPDKIPKTQGAKKKSKTHRTKYKSAPKPAARKRGKK
jgi:hypothetical protein